MNLATITMDRNEARKAFLEYRHAVQDRHSDEDAQIMQGYRELARGKQLIHLGDTMRAGGYIDQPFKTWRGQKHYRLPRLAVMRADQRLCFVEVSAEGTVRFHPSTYGPRSLERRNVVRVPQAIPMEGRPEGVFNTRFDDGIRAMVPIVPAGLRPKAKLGNYHILWEAEWECVKPPRPPGDPALLKHIGGDLYAVVAIWDLSPLERAVLSGRTNG